MQILIRPQLKCNTSSLSPIIIRLTVKTIAVWESCVLYKAILMWACWSPAGACVVVFDVYWYPLTIRPVGPGRQSLIIWYRLLSCKWWISRICYGKFSLHREQQNWVWENLSSLGNWNLHTTRRCGDVQCSPWWISELHEESDVEGIMIS